MLLARADASASSLALADLRAEAGEVYEQKLNDTAGQRSSTPGCSRRTPGTRRRATGWRASPSGRATTRTLAHILERRAESRRGQDKSDALLKIAEVYEDHLEDLAEATRRFEAVLALDPHDLQALKGLDRIYNRTGKYRELLDNLEQQVALAATPRQKIELLERMAALHDEEFLDHERAAESPRRHPRDSTRRTTRR